MQAPWLPSPSRPRRRGADSDSWNSTAHFRFLERPSPKFHEHRTQVQPSWRAPQLTAPTTVRRRRLFQFFKLPRELRDAIYAECTYSGSPSSNEWCFGVRISSCLLPSLRIVSKDFQREYEEEHPHGSLVIDVPSPIRLPTAPAGHWRHCRVCISKASAGSDLTTTSTRRRPWSPT